MASNAEVIFRIKADTGEIISKLNGLQASGEKTDKVFSKSAVFSGAIGGIAATGIGKITGLFTGLTTRIMSSADSATKFEQSLKFAGLNDKKIKQLQESVREFSRTSIFAIEDLLDTTSKLASNAVPNADELTKALGGITAAGQGTREQFGSIADGFLLVQSTGKLSAEAWDPFKRYLPAVGALIKDELKKIVGYTGSFEDAMSKNKISFEDFSKAIKNIGLSKEAQEIAGSTKTFEGIINSFNSTVSSFGKKLLKEIGEENIKNALKNIQKVFKETLDEIIDFIKFLKENKTILIQFSVAIGVFATSLELLKFGNDASKGIMKIGKETKVWIQLIKQLITSEGALIVIQELLAVTNPFGWIGLAVAAVVVLVALIILNWDTVKKVTLNVFKSISDFVGGIFDSIKSFIEPLVIAISGFISGIVNVIMILLAPLIEYWKGMFNIWLTVVTGFINIVVGIFNILVALIQIALSPLIAIFQAIISGIVGLFNGLSAIVRPIFNGIATTIKNVFNSIKSFISPVINFMISAFKKAASSISGVFRNMANTIKGVFNGVVNFIKSIMNGIIDGINVVIGGINAIPGHSKVSKIPKLAKGGVVNRPTQAIIGEAGPEAVVPLTPKGISSFMQGIIGYNSGKHDNGKTTNITMNITNNGHFDGKSVERYLAKLAKQGGM